MSKTPHEIKKEVVLYSHIMDEKGLVNSLEGNLSILDRESGLLYITPTATRKAFLDEDMIAVMDGDEQVGGSVRRSSEYLLHKVALESRPDCNAVLHCHSPYLTAYAFCGKGVDIDCSTTFSILHDGIPCIPYGEPGKIDITNGLKDAIQSHDIVLLANHGIVCVAKDLEHACAVVEATEAVMRIHFLATVQGMTPLSIPEAALEKMKADKRGTAPSK
ncbi:MAG: class II aldolase/adducin family protein [Atopobiaceae bacterium]|jgi:L-fuculose-phosphate aldolase|nr:class II aldolase/adducin family protein [Atopobiaceae bacterium]MCI1318142.1 class II aldolase/adducin family protein [Atopobiaceae bacterium]MCI1388979.1 class II aldolase/adducin family protein [Atopobiaceae bacterium]